MTLEQQIANLQNRYNRLVSRQLRERKAKDEI